MVYLLPCLVPLLEAVKIGFSGDLRVWKIEFLINLLNPTILNVYDYLYEDPEFGRSEGHIVDLGAEYSLSESKILTWQILIQISHKIANLVSPLIIQ
jgi:hypothetical protein